VIPDCEKKVIGLGSSIDCTAINCPFDGCNMTSLKWLQVEKRKYGCDKHVPRDRAHFKKTVLDSFGHGHEYLQVLDNGEK